MLLNLLEHLSPESKRGEEKAKEEIVLVIEGNTEKNKSND